MNAILDVLKLRRVKLDYVSPPVCPGFPISSSSGSGISVEANEGAETPVIRLAGQCDSFLLWNDILDLICMTVLRASEPEGVYAPIVECLPPNMARVCSPGWWVATTVDSDGVEGQQTTPVLSDGNTPVLILLPRNPGDKSFRLYKNPDPKNIAAGFQRVLESTTFGAVELCGGDACYRAQAITDDGLSEFSDAKCRVTEVDCCPPVPCSPGEAWDSDVCSCTRCNLSGIQANIPDACVGVPVVGTFQALGAVGPTTWTLLDGALPEGVYLIGGTLPEDVTSLGGTPSESGTFVFTVKATDSVGCEAKKLCTLTTMKVLPLPVGKTDTAYSQQIVTSGGVPPYGFAALGALPDGITLSSTGLVSGTARFSGNATIEVVDSEETRCQTPLEIDGCPHVDLYNAVSAWDTFPAALYATATFDEARRIWWLPSSVQFPGPSYAQVALVDTAVGAFIGYATDPNGVINTAAKANYSNFLRGVIDTNYNQFVIGGRGASGGISFFDLDTKEAVGWIPYTGAEMGFGEAAYDSLRGYVYVGVYPNQPQEITVVDCNRGARAQIGQYSAAGGIMGGRIAYCPDNDKVYIGNGGGGTHLFYTWDPVTHAYDYTAGPLGVSGSNNSVYYIPGVKLVMVGTSGSMSFFDPNQGNALVGTATYTGVSSPLFQMVYNPCSNRIYTAQYGLAGAAMIDPANAFAVSPVAGLSHHMGDLAFDALGNKLYAYDNDTRGLLTTA